MDKCKRSQSRVLWLDVLKGICMLLIVLSHSNSPHIYSRFYTPCFLSGFFFASGYTIKTDINFKDYFLHKLQGLMYPFLTLGCINAIIAIIFEGDKIGDRAMYLLSLEGKWDDLWFIPCLFSAEIIYWFVVRLSSVRHSSEKKHLVCILISYIITLLGLLYKAKIGHPLVWQFENACVCVIFIALGDAFRAVEKEIALKTNIYKHVFISLIIYVAIVLVYDNAVSVHDVKYQSWTVYFVSALVGIMLLYYVSVTICKLYVHVMEILTYIGQNTLVFYAFQSKAIKISSALWNRFFDVNSIYIKPIFVSAVAVVILMFPAYIVNKYFHWILKLKKLRLD